MTYSSGYLHLTWGGPMFTSESWSCGVKLSGQTWTNGASDDAYAACNVALTDMANTIKTMHTAAAGQAQYGAELAWLKLNPVDAQGRQSASLPTLRWDFNPAWHGPATACPAQLAWVVSLRTAAPRGPAHAGRIFLPGGGAPAPDGATGVAVATTINGILETVGAAFAGINGYNAWTGANNQALPTPKIHIMSHMPASNPASRIVTGIRMGRIVDTQRRRRRSLPESYSALTAI